jgi:hypothetical protein
MMSFRGAGYLGKNDVTWGQANSTGMPPDTKVNKAKDLLQRDEVEIPKQ